MVVVPYGDAPMSEIGAREFAASAVRAGMIAFVLHEEAFPSTLGPSGKVT
jgi:hypothetical protein